ncbi:hypothetical protein PHISP_03725 [Aspergillus sp. HF37]|nr:hypothetical protein PHISP_03725 [Aspergillus sp. HF37]
MTALGPHNSRRQMKRREHNLLLVSKDKKPTTDTFNIDAASQGIEQFAETDCFVAQYVIIRAQASMHDTQSQDRDQKSHEVTMPAIDKPKNVYDYVMDKDGMSYYHDMDCRNYREAAFI